MKRIFSLLLVAVFCLTFMPTVGLATSSRETNEMYAHEYNTNMLLYFSENGYPDHYGGAYLNQTTGNLIINLIESSPEIEDFYYEITNASVLEFETVEYSFKELMDALYEVPASLNSTKSTPRITGGALIQKDNKIELYVDSDSLVEYSAANAVKMLPENHFSKSVPKLDMIRFELGDCEINYEGSASPGFGARFGSSTVNISGSIGYLAQRTGTNGIEYGFVTAAHCFLAADTLNVYDSSKNLIGTQTYCPAEGLVGPGTPSDSLDVAFVKLSSNTIASTTIYGDTTYSQEMNGNYIIPVEGGTIYKSGTKTGCTSGYVLSLYFVIAGEDAIPSNPTIYDVRRIKSNYNSTNGDSGGFVYVKTLNNIARPVGIHQGSTVGLIDGATTTYPLCISAYNILQDHGITPGHN